jgi:hypothetical protein
MRYMDPPLMDVAMRGRPDDDIDGLMRAYFRTEMPDPWPPLSLPDEGPVVLPKPMPVRRSLFRSRLALAASVAFLLAGPWFLSDSFKQLTNKSVPSLDQGTAHKGIIMDTYLKDTPDGVGIRIDARYGGVQEAPGKPMGKKIADDVKDMLP